MTLNLARVNMSGLRDLSKCAHLLGKLSNLRADVVAVPVTGFICATDSRMLEKDFVVFSAYESCCSAGVSLLSGHECQSCLCW